MNIDFELQRALQAHTVRCLTSGHLPTVDPIPGVTTLDMWAEGSDAAMLFFMDKSADLYQDGLSRLIQVEAERIDGRWEASYGGGYSQGSLEGPFVGLSPGVHYEGASTTSTLRTYILLATPEVEVIRLRSQYGRVRVRKPGRHGYVLFGITPEDPITYATAIDHDGNEIPGEPIELCCPPRD